MKDIVQRVAYSTLLCGLLLSAAHADPLDLTETWSGEGLAGWTGGGGQAAMTNAAGYLSMQFTAQGYPSPASCVARYALPDAAVVTNLSFRFLAADGLPSVARLHLASRDGEEWCLPLAGIPRGEWIEFDIPVRFDAGWTIGPRTKQALFDRDMAAVGSVALYVARDGSARPQAFGVDDFRIQGLQPSAALSISGSIAYGGEQNGSLHVIADPLAGSATGAETVAAGPGAFEITGLPGWSDHRVWAFLDSNANATRDFWEAHGEWRGNPARLLGSNIAGVAFAITDPASQDGLPYWWLKRHFDIPDPRTAGDPAMADVDSDGDGMLNYGEFRAGTDPTNLASVFEITIEAAPGQPGPVLRWSAAPGRTYSLWSTEDLGAGFALREGGIPADWPTNAYPDAGAGSATKRYYRVQVE